MYLVMLIAYCREAIFFLLTTTLIVFGLIAFDNTIAIIDTFPDLFPGISSTPSLWAAVRALLIPYAAYDSDRITGMEQALHRLERKSRSFFLASSTFEGGLRIDLILLYSFCRVADDLVDSAKTISEAEDWINKLRQFLDLAYASASGKGHDPLVSFITTNFPSNMRHALLQLPVSYLSKQPLYDLLTGFEMDLQFTEDYRQDNKKQWPIKDEPELRKYGAYVAGTVAALCLDAVYHHYPESVPSQRQPKIKQSGHDMGIALQIINIARDIQVDAGIKRVYVPTDWLKEHGLTAEDVLENPTRHELGKIRSRLLERAFETYNVARLALDELPNEVRGPMKVAVESYMEIGRVLRKARYTVKPGRATVPKLRRIAVAWRALGS